MPYDFLWSPEADDAMAAMDADPDLDPAVRAVGRTLARLAEDPFNLRLGTTAFVTAHLGGISATPTRHDDWYVLWQRGEDRAEIEIVLVCQLHI